MSESFDFGREAEEYAAQFLANKGYKILARNYFYDRAEIDIVAQLNNLLVVVEVKARQSVNVEFPEAAVTYRKRRQIVKAAEAYIQDKQWEHETRFDIMAMVKTKEKWHVEHIEDAFLSFE